MAAKRAIWRTDWFVGVLVVLAVSIAALMGVFNNLDRAVYDAGATATARKPSDRIAIINIDEQSIANIGRWPWSRDVHARMIDMLAQAKAKVIVNTVFFSEPQRDPGLQYIERMLQMAEKQAAPAPAVLPASGVAPEAAASGVLGVPASAVAAAPAVAPVAPVISAELAPFVAVLKEAESALNTDRKLAASIKSAGNVLMPINLTVGDPRGNADRPLPEYIAKWVIPGNSGAVNSTAFEAPLQQLSEAAAGIGHLNIRRESDGTVRTDSLIQNYFGAGIPSLALTTAAKSLNLSPVDIKVIPGEAVQVGKLRIATDETAAMNTYFYKTDQPFAKDSFSDVLSGKVPASKFADKIVLIGTSAAGTGSTFAAPGFSSMGSVDLLAHTTSSILQEHFFVAPWWGKAITYGAFLLIAAYIIVLLPRLRAAIAAITTLGILVALLGLSYGLMVGPGLWVPVMLSVALLVIGHLCLTTKRFLVTEAGKQKSDVESAESNRMLGLAFQGQGQLDMAFDKFRKCPLDDQLMDNMYNLALDFERKRQFNKAQSVYEYMGTYNPKYKDLETKLNRAKQMSETVILGGGATRGNSSTLLTDGQIEKPMLGRYQVEKELGKGAMGVVYMGKDPKIGRVVAIKTMALSQEFEADELGEVKERFFREAETAGRLNHPNIVTIYDAGEEHDLCFIAMELLKGKDLVPYTKPENLMPVERVISVVARVAEALAYAHRNGVIHRDIKPANIMYEPDADVVKVTDFGIARIADSSKTKTGMVLGTPSFMSPEQLQGLRIDGRSDIFSLAVSLFQMLTGKLPFTGESMAQLMFRIANEPTPDVMTIRADLPPAVVAVIVRGMEKDRDARYQTGDDMARDLRAILSGNPNATHATQATQAQHVSHVPLATTSVVPGVPGAGPVPTPPVPPTTTVPSGLSVEPNAAPTRAPQHAVEVVVPTAPQTTAATAQTNQAAKTQPLPATVTPAPAAGAAAPKKPDGSIDFEI